jgi:hypothetical protein
VNGPVGTSFWVGWMGACGASWLIGWLLRLGGLPSGITMLVVGLLLGGGQWLVLRRYGISLRSWGPLTFFGWGVGALVSGLLVVGVDQSTDPTQVATDLGRQSARGGGLDPERFLIVGATVVQGTIVGAAQSLYLRRLVSRTWRWVAANAGGQAVGWTLFIWGGLDPGSIGVQFGIVTGIVMQLMLNERALAAGGKSQVRSASGSSRNNARRRGPPQRRA